MLERVVEALDVRFEQARTAGIITPQQPHLLLPADVGEIPHQRAHQGVVLAQQLGIIDLDQPQGAFARQGEVPGQRLSTCHAVGPANRVTAARTPPPTTRSAKSSAELLPRCT